MKTQFLCVCMMIIMIIMMCSAFSSSKDLFEDKLNCYYLLIDADKDQTEELLYRITKIEKLEYDNAERFLDEYAAKNNIDVKSKAAEFEIIGNDILKKISKMKISFQMLRYKPLVEIYVQRSYNYKNEILCWEDLNIMNEKLKDVEKRAVLENKTFREFVAYIIKSNVSENEDIVFEADKTPADLSGLGKDLKDVYGEFLAHWQQRGYRSGSRTELIYDNNEAWYARWKMLDMAEKTLDITYFMMYNDIFGRAFLGKLLRKAEQGVKIRLMIDSRGSMFFAGKGDDYLEELAAHKNIKIKIYNSIIKGLPQLPLNLRYVTASNHDKIIIVDDRLCITGGRNIGDDYFVHINDSEEAWRDADVIIENPAVCRQLKTAFIEEYNNKKNWKITKDWIGNWNSKRRELLYAVNTMDSWIKEGRFSTKEEHRSSHGSREWNPKPDMYNKEISLNRSMVKYNDYKMFAREVNAHVMIIDKHSFLGKTNSITDAICRFIDASKKEVVIQNPYVVLTEKAWAALKRAGERGVKVIIHTNSPLSSDSIFTQAFFVDDWKKMLTEIKGSELYAYTGNSNLHAKVFVFDRKISIVGTYNMDPMSEQINSEVVAAVYSEEFSEQLYNEIAKDIAISKAFTLATDKNSEEFGPVHLADKKLRRILNILRKLKFLRPLI